MNKALLIPMHKKWVDLIKKGLKTRELRTWIPKDYVGTVFVVSTKSSGGSGKVELSFWFDEYDVIEYIYAWHGDYKINGREIQNGDYLKLQLNYYHLNNYLGYYKKGYAWHIKKLEVFDEPKQLSDFYSPKIFEHLNAYVNTDIFRITKAPQRSQWVYVNE